MMPQQKNKKSLPEFLRKYFWDVDFGKINVKKYSPFVIGRILEYGDGPAIKWMLKNFEKSQIKKTLVEKKGISPKSAAFWALIFNVPKDKILCLKKYYQKTRKSHWPY